MVKTMQKRRKRFALGLNAGDVERAASQCPAHMSLKVKKALSKEIEDFKRSAKAQTQTRQDAEQSANGGPTLDAYQEWLERNEGHEPSEANPDIVSDEDGIKYLPSKRDYETETLLKEFRQALTDKQLQVWNLVMRHNMSKRKAANLLCISEMMVRKQLAAAKQKLHKFGEAINHVGQD
jgi:DNA-directed RNA polymerase specialized sigma subunit